MRTAAWVFPRTPPATTARRVGATRSRRRPMAIRAGGLHHLAIRATDLERARRCYTQTLGFATVLEFPGGVIVDAGGTLLGVRGGAAETPVGDHFDPHRVGLDHLALAVEPAQ